MTLIRIIKNWDWPDIMQQTPNKKGIWLNYKFTEKKIEKVDYIIILNNYEKDIKTKCKFENIWRIVQEPPIDFFKNWHKNPVYSFKTFCNDPILTGNQHIKTQPMLPWHVNRDYDFLATTKIPKKTCTLSWITSTKQVLAGHKKRMSFLNAINGKIPELNLLGGGIYHLKGKQKQDNDLLQEKLGFNKIIDKWDGLAPYKYSLAIENYSGPYYWSEKLADCFLSWTVPIYYGCTNLENYFPVQSFIKIDITKPDEAINIIQNAIKQNCWKKRIDALTKARELVLNKYQLFPSIINHIKTLKKMNIIRSL